MPEEEFITKVKKKALEEELVSLKGPKRKEILESLEFAKSLGDLSENAEYHAAKEKQSFIEGRIQEIKTKLALAHVIDPSKISQDKAAFGAKVKVLDVNTDEKKIFTLVGPEEADIKNQKISIHSPVGKSLIGKSVGDTVTIIAPAKTMEYEILEIRFE